MKTKYTPEIQSVLSDLIKEEEELTNEIITLSTEIDAARDRLGECRSRLKVVKNHVMHLEKANEVLKQNQ